jgi:hypothetical protein
LNSRAFFFICFLVSVLACSVVFAADLGSITICKGVAGPELNPVNPTDRFTPDTDVIHAVARINNGQPGNKIKGVWISVDAISTPDYEIHSTELVLGERGTVNGSFSISKPTNGWPKGNYRIDVYIEGKKVGAASYSIQ